MAPGIQLAAILRQAPPRFDVKSPGHQGEQQQRDERRRLHA
jgi:hypothetical protein